MMIVHLKKLCSCSMKMKILCLLMGFFCCCLFFFCLFVCRNVVSVSDLQFIGSFLVRVSPILRLASLNWKVICLSCCGRWLEALILKIQKHKIEAKRQGCVFCEFLLQIKRKQIFVQCESTEDGLFGCCGLCKVPFFFRWALREQTDQASAPQTVAFHGLGSDHGEEISPCVHATTVATHHLEAEDGPSGELTQRHPHVWHQGRTHYLHASHSLFALKGSTGKARQTVMMSQSWQCC